VKRLFNDTADPGFELAGRGAVQGRAHRSLAHMKILPSRVHGIGRSSFQNCRWLPGVVLRITAVVERARAAPPSDQYAGPRNLCWRDPPLPSPVHSSAVQRRDRRITPLTSQSDSFSKIPRPTRVFGEVSAEVRAAERIHHCGCRFDGACRSSCRPSARNCSNPCKPELEKIPGRIESTRNSMPFSVPPLRIERQRIF